MPPERHSVTDTSSTRIAAGVADITRQIMALGVTHGAAGLEDQSRLLSEIYQVFEQECLQYSTEQGNVVYLVFIAVAQLVMAKLRLIVFLPVLFSSPNEHISTEIRTKLLIAAVEVAENNHVLNAEEAYRRWRWVYQTYTHWYAIVYLMIEIIRRPWSPTVERAWVALHSNWLIPARPRTEKNLRIWVPLRRLMEKARKHRDEELNRLRADPQAAARLELEDQETPLPSSSGPFPTGSSVQMFRERWRRLVSLQKGPGASAQTSEVPGVRLVDPSMHEASTSRPNADALADSEFNMTFDATYLGRNGRQDGPDLESNIVRDAEVAVATEAPRHSYEPFPMVPADWSGGSSMGPDFFPWLGTDTDPSVDIFPSLDLDSIDVDVDLNDGMDWYAWAESAKGMD